MNGSWETLAVALVRTTLVTSIAAVVAMWLLWVLRIRAARTHRIVWLLVIAQGWLLWPYTWRMPDSWGTKVEPVYALIDPPTAAEEVVVQPTVVKAVVLPETATPPAINITQLAIEWSLAAWCGGIAVLVAIGTWQYARLFASGRPGDAVTNHEWLAEWDEVRRNNASKHRAELRTTHNTGPLVCWVPWVLLVLVPRPLWANLARGERLAILRHELAHCERGDLWKNLAVRLLALPQWFNPLVWLAVRRFEEAGEWACDERVARDSGDSSTGDIATDYARVLLRVADDATHVPSGAAGMASGVLSRRVKRLLHLPNKEVQEMRGFILPVLLVTMGLFQAVRIERVEADEPAAAKHVPPTAAEETKRNDKSAEKKPPKSKWAFDQPYVIEPPDILLINAKKVVPKSPHKIEAFDGLLIRAKNVDERAPIDNAYFVQPEGYIDLGPSYGEIHVAGIPISKAGDLIRVHLEDRFPKAEISVSLSVAAATQHIVGDHLVGPDGRMNLGTYGSVYVTGLTLDEAKRHIEAHLAKYLVDPQVTVDVMAYNSKKYYIIEKGVQVVGRHGVVRRELTDNVVACPITGNETVLDAIAALGGLSKLKSPKIWIDRPAPHGQGESKILPVNYDATSKDAISNHAITIDYQLWPGDRLFIEYGDQGEPALPEQAYESPTPIQEDDIPNYHEYVRPALEAKARADAQPERYYIITKSSGHGDNIVTAPITGNDTVLDAIAAIGGLEGEPKLWVERDDRYSREVLDVHWHDITQGKNTSTNHRLLPGDRLFIEYPKESKPAVPEQVKEETDLADRYAQPNPNEPARATTQAEPELIASSINKYYQVFGRTFEEGEFSKTVPLTGPTTVRDVLSPYRELHVDTKVWFVRPSEIGKKNAVKMVDWNAISRGNSETNYHISPGDRICIQETQGAIGVGVNSDAGVVGKIELEEQKPARPVVERATHLRALPTVEGDERMTKAKIRLVTDPKQNLRNVDGLEKGFSITGETRLLEGLLGVLAKNDLTRELASPTITAVNGQVARVRVADDETDPPREIDIELLNRQSGDQVVFETRACVHLGKRKRTLDTAFALTEGQSILVRIPKDENAPESEDLYLLVSREPAE